MAKYEEESAFDKIMKLGKTREIFFISISLAGIMLFILLLNAIDAAPIPLEPIDWAMLATLSFFGPFGFYVSYKQNEIKQIERRLPDFLRDVAEAGRFGMTLADAIVVSASGRYGKLTPEIEKMAAQIDWGIPASQALELFAERVDTPLVNRVVAIIIKANDAGGNVADVLGMVSRDTKQIHLSEDEQSIAMTSYLAVIYISFAVFIVVIIILNTQFLAQMAEAGAQLEGDEEGGEVDDVDEMAGSDMSTGAEIRTDIIPTIRFIFTLAVFAHSIGDGLVAGVLQSGRIAEGMKHTFVLTLIGFVALRILFGGIGMME
ncbi:MAG: type II secretion system F family protein [Thermoplasmatota archaeon]